MDLLQGLGTLLIFIVWTIIVHHNSYNEGYAHAIDDLIKARIKRK
jgi:hypothetical protein